jgi:hypothetical protein
MSRIIADSEIGVVVLTQARELVNVLAAGQHQVLRESLKILDAMPRETFLGAMQIALDATETVAEMFRAYAKGLPVEQAQWAIFATGLISNMMTTTGVACQSLNLMDPKSGDVYDPPGIARYIQYTGLTCLGTQVLAAAAYDMYSKLDNELDGKMDNISGVLELLKDRGHEMPTVLKGEGAQRPEKKAKATKRPKKVTFPKKLDVDV